MKLTPAQMRRSLAGMRNRRVLVVGDLMLDRYVYGSVQRISPEAPVPVVNVTGEKCMPGGAANTAWNIRVLGGRAALSGVLGRDHAAGLLTELLRREQVDLQAVIQTTALPTTIKMRIVAERQQVVRVDWEGRDVLAAAVARRLIGGLAAAVARADAVILEDYGKGVLTLAVIETVMRLAGRRRIPVGLDPKQFDLVPRGLALVTPNRKEAFSAAGAGEPATVHPEPLQDKALLAVAETLREKWAPELLMITLGAQGMLLAPRRGNMRHVPTRAREVFDVSGAGDTVIAACMLALGAGIAPFMAAEIANHAAGVVVAKLGTATCSPAELLASVKG